MSERFKEKITVSAEVKTYLKDLYHQIEYELREDYEDSLEKTNSILTELEEWLNLEISIHDEDDTIDILYSCVLNKIQELKEKYK